MVSKLPPAFWHWVAWRLRNKKGPRPPDVPKVIPRSWWLALERWTRRHKKPPPPPPPPPPAGEKTDRWTNPPWRGVGVHVAWAFSSGQYTPQTLADKIAGTRVAWAAVEGSPADNEPYMAAFRDALHAHGRRFGIWERDDTQRNYPGSFIDHARHMIETYRPDFYGADIETFPVEEPSFPGEFAKAFPDMPRIMLIPGQPDAATLAPWFAADWAMMSQCYAANIGQPPVPGIAGPTDHDAYWRNCPRNFVKAPSDWGKLWWQHGSGPHHVPIIEVWAEGNPSLEAQWECDAIQLWDGNWSVWSAELLRDEDWALLK